MATHHELTAQAEPVITSYAKAPARTVTAGGVTYAYRELGPKGGIPVVFFVHLAATLDNWDPRIIDPIAKDHHVITFDNRGVGASTGTGARHHRGDGRRRLHLHHARSGSTRSTSSPSPSAAWSPRPWSSSTPTWSASSSSPEPDRAGGKDIDKVAGTTYYDILRATLTRSDPKEFLFFNRNATGKPAAKAFVERLEERTVDRDAHDQRQGVPDPAEGDQEVGPLRTRRTCRRSPSPP